MKNKFMEQASLCLVEYGIATLRFNFPYMEKGKKVPDTKSVCSAAISAAVEKALKLCPKLPLFAGGKSFGGRMTSTAASEGFGKCKRNSFFGFLFTLRKTIKRRAAPIRLIFRYSSRL
jgi:predicted alpha/beta-hydrolase family hydrolase